MLVLCLFQLDKFRELITNMRVFSHVSITEERKAAILENNQKGDEAALDFGLDWMELVIFRAERGLGKNNLPNISQLRHKKSAPHSIARERFHISGGSLSILT